MVVVVGTGVVVAFIVVVGGNVVVGDSVSVSFESTNLGIQKGSAQT